MKNTLLLVLATLFATVTFAQQQLATLDHNDTITVYYGPTALTSAYNAATDGDIITLSSGTFNSPGIIDKAVTIRGAGMYADTVAGTLATTIDNILTLVKDGTATSHIKIEGIHFLAGIKYGNCNSTDISHVEIVKCVIPLLAGFIYTGGVCNTNTAVTRTLKEATIVDCVIKKMVVHYSYLYSQNVNKIANSHFINCAILNMEGDGTTGLYNTLSNCVAHVAVGNDRNFTISNSVLYEGGTNSSSSSSLVNNSIGVNPGNGHNYFDTTITAGQSLRNYNSLTDVFEDFNGTYNYGSTTFKLKSNVAASVLGSDGTQVGIYGGDVPFDPSVRNSMIGKLNVARRTNAQGKLEVNVDITEE